MKQSLGFCLLVLLPLTARAAELAPLQPLFDFEQGLSGWWANPWGGGKAFVEPAPEAKFGQGALQARYVDVVRGANIICPEFPADAPWREGDYDTLVFWVKGDGSAGRATMILEAGLGDNPLTFSASVALDSQKWRRYAVKFDTLWNRQDQPFVLRNFRRLYLGCSGTHTVLLDGLALQRPLRQVPLAAVQNPGPAALEPRLYAPREGAYLLNFDPSLVLEPTVAVELTATWPGGRAERLLRDMPAQDATAEAWLVVPGLPGQDGDGRLQLALREPDGDLCYRGDFIFPVALSTNAPAPDKLGLVPQPKSLTYHPGQWRVPDRLEVRLLAAADLAAPGAQRLAHDLHNWFGRETTVLSQPLRDEAPAVVTVGPPGTSPDLPEEVRDRLPQLPAEGYVLHVRESGLVLAATDAAGMRYAALTALQLLRSAPPGTLRVPSLTIADWPSLPVRAARFGLPTTRWGHPNDAPVPVDFFLDFLRRNVVDLKYNVVCLEILNGMKFDKHPELAGPAAWSKDEVRRVVQFLKDNGIEVIPEVNSLGHADWLVIWDKEFREDGDTNTLCTRHPDIRKTLTEVYDEVLEVFEPTRFHMGLDEIRWKTFSVPEDQRCPRCLKVPKTDLFLEHVTWLEEYCKNHNVQMLMWADMLLPEHGGGSPFFLDRTLDKLPRDIIMCDWSTSLAPLSLWDLQRRGFTVWKSNSLGANRLQLRWIAGNMYGVWSRVPWLVEAGWNAQGYCYLNLPVAAEYSWNPYPDLQADCVPLTPEYYAKRPLLQGWLAADPVAGGGETITSLEPGGSALKLAGLSLAPFATPVTDEHTFALQQPTAALYLLLTADLPADQATAFRDLFKQKQNWAGVPVGELRVTYADGQTATQPLLYGAHVRACRPGEPFPQAYAALGQAPVGAGDAARLAYLVRWSNPHPEKAVASVQFVPGALAAKVMLCGLAWQQVRAPGP